MRHPYLCLGLLSLLPLASGCERLQDDPVFVYGRLEQRDGTPVSGGVLPYARTIHRDPKGETNLVYELPDFSAYGEVSTEARGDFFLEMRYGDVESIVTPNLGLQPYRFRTSWRDEVGAGVFASFIFHDDVELPTLRIWDSQLTVTPQAEGAVVTFGAPPPLPEAPMNGEYFSDVGSDGNFIPLLPSTPEATLFIQSGGQMLFRTWLPSSLLTVSRYVLEDFAEPTVMLRAVSLGEFIFYPLGGKTSMLWLRMDWRTEELPLPSGGLVPVSRGAACQPSPPGGCPWTDGKLDPVPVGEKPVESLVVTLAEPRTLRHVVVRGAEEATPAGFVLEGSQDSEQWTRLAVLRKISEEDTVSRHWMMRARFEKQSQWDSPFDGQLSHIWGPHFMEAPLAADAGPVRYVRLRAVYFNFVGDPQPSTMMAPISELSLFE
ncbi:hypothetical protein [Myxococcus qinghaiensis]|uniref:hypothetical protein n=1 Tax=Myxococcus qinghaiensis TaxID=2906758 RepID=UPI0020A6E285|nr:hypothetical protein [Myxococcus qinghaiensis]MCP3166838.1 hypothetical protein [Myxococcus qinghaiensis]